MSQNRLERAFMGTCFELNCDKANGAKKATRAHLSHVNYVLYRGCELLTVSGWALSRQLLVILPVLFDSAGIRFDE